MQYFETNEQAGEMLRMALRLMAQHQVAPTPIHYTIWYEYVSGVNSPLRAAMESFVGDGTPLSPEIHQTLYDQYILDGDRVTSRRMIKEIQRIIDEVAREVKTTGGNVARQGEKLQALAGPLEQVDDLVAIRKVVDFLINTTRQILHSSNHLENRLSEATIEVDTLRQKMVSLKAKAMTDALTGLVNRWGLEKLLMQEISQARETGKELSIIMADIDHFKMINDTYGHLVGDNVIKMFAATLTDFVKGRDLVVRYGGEEFLVVLPDTPLVGAVTLSMKMQSFLENMKWKRKENGNPLGKITLSFGVAKYRPGESIEDLIHRADSALYYSKQHGRNRVTAENEVVSS
ncbi:MAG: GGDEF domain-containing protein [Pseudomonadota bacterium]